MEQRWDNPAVSRHYAELKEAGAGTPQLHLLVSDPPSHPEWCTCRQRGSFILYTGWQTLESPLWCGDCFQPVPLHWLPKPALQWDYHDVKLWEMHYRALFRVQTSNAGCCPKWSA